MYVLRARRGGDFSLKNGGCWFCEGRGERAAFHVSWAPVFLFALWWFRRLMPPRLGGRVVLEPAFVVDRSVVLLASTVTHNVTAVDVVRRRPPPAFTRESSVGG